MLHFLDHSQNLRGGFHFDGLVQFTQAERLYGGLFVWPGGR